MDNQNHYYKTDMSDKRMHLQFIEKAIDRMASNSFLIKGWSLTAIGGLIALYIANQSKAWSYDLLILIFCLIIMFWGHDTFYLRQERQYRKLYEKVVDTAAEEIDYSMIPPVSKENLLCVATAPILLWSYGIAAGFLIFMLFILK